MPRKRTCTSNLGLLAGALAAALLLGEAVLRLAGQSYYWALAKRSDPVLGWRPPPNIAAWQRFEGAALVQTNGLGFRDQDHPREKPADALRVAVLGDSFTEAVQVSVDETWWRVMAALLNSDACATPARFEVLNFAVSGWSTAQSLLAWRHHARGFGPDVVVLAFFIGNDLTENHPALDDEPLRPYFRLGESGLVLDDRFRRHPSYRAATSPVGRARQWIMERSRIAQLLIQARDAGRLRRFSARPAEGAAGGVRPATQAATREATQEASRGAPQHPPREPGVDNAIYREPVTATWRETWAITEAMLAAFAEEVRAAGATPVLMPIGTGVQVHPDARLPARFAAALDLPDLGYPVRRLLAVADRHDIAVLNLPALLAAHAEQEAVILHGFPGGQLGLGHWNAAGHHVVGQAAADLVCRTAAVPNAQRDQAGRHPASMSGIQPHGKHAKKSG